jgi:hypothetical protein
VDIQEGSRRRPVARGVNTKRNVTSVGTDDLLDSRRLRRCGYGKTGSDFTQVLPAAWTTPRHPVRIEGAGTVDVTQVTGIDQLGECELHRHAEYEWEPPSGFPPPRRPSRWALTHRRVRGLDRRT